MNVALLAALTLAVPEAKAEIEPPTRPPRIWFDAATDVPLHVGGRLEVEAWHRLRVWTSLGVLPGPYVEIIDGIAQELGGYNDATSELVVSSLDESFVWRVHAGWRPFEDEGFTVDAGYTLATLGGDTRASELLGAALGRDIDAVSGSTFDIDSTLHSLGIELGWRWSILNELTLRAAVGFVGTVASSTRVASTPNTRVSQAISDELAGYLDGIYTSYVYFPYVGIGIGYGLHGLSGRGFSGAR